MTATIYVCVEPSDDPALVLVRTSATPNPERRPPMRVSRDELDKVLLALLDSASAEVKL
ncbi:hypothetical protein [Paraburkholderia sp. Cpub6]|uniref:hypothetical protein n=1 Tax=Paraburkholderia sp. Cpub6 TaxID=2723094 RepID=UPI0016128814|nr:hypothetical protein [Paraburkholderia sp. Cpub6]MBB5458694.1 hypothetical protein [Paraburkholderia sp. Cpub6]